MTEGLNTPVLVTVSVGLNIYDIYLTSPIHDYIQKHIAQSGKPYELSLLEDMGRRLSRESIVIDVGANIGNHTFYLANTVGCRVIAFEPNAELVEAMQMTVNHTGLQQLVTVYEYALGSQKSTARFDKSPPENAGAQSLKLGEGSIQVYALDSIDKINKIDAMKIDVEGMELDVLKGASNYLKQYKPIIYIECISLERFREVTEFLAELGYEYVETFNATPTHLFLNQKSMSEQDLELRLKQVENIYISSEIGKSVKQLNEYQEKYREVTQIAKTLGCELDVCMQILEKAKSSRRNTKAKIKKLKAAYREQSEARGNINKDTEIERRSGSAHVLPDPAPDRDMGSDREESLEPLEKPNAGLSTLQYRNKLSEYEASEIQRRLAAATEDVNDKNRIIRELENSRENDLITISRLEEQYKKTIRNAREIFIREREENLLFVRNLVNQRQEAVASISAYQNQLNSIIEYKGNIEKLSAERTELVPYEFQEDRKHTELTENLQSLRQLAQRLAVFNQLRSDQASTNVSDLTKVSRAMEPTQIESDTKNEEKEPFDKISIVGEDQSPSKLVELHNVELGIDSTVQQFNREVSPGTKLRCLASINYVNTTTTHNKALLLLSFYNAHGIFLDFQPESFAWTNQFSSYYKYLPDTKNQEQIVYDGLVPKEAAFLRVGIAGFDLKKNESIEINCFSLEFEADKNQNKTISSHLFQIYDEHGEEALVKELLELYFEEKNLAKIKLALLLDFVVTYSVSRLNVQKIIINLSNKLNKLGYLKDQVSLLDICIELDKSVFSVTAAYWGFVRAGDISRAKSCVLWLSDICDKSPEISIQKLIKEAKESYVFLSVKDIRDLIEESESKYEEGCYQPISKKIAYILHNSLPYASGGYAIRGHGLATKLQESGYETVIINRPGFPLDTNSEVKISDITLESSIDDLKYLRILSPSRKGLTLLEYIKQASQALFEKFNIVRPSIVIAASNHLTALPALIASKQLGIPFYYEVRGFWEITRISREPEFEFSELYKKLSDFEVLAAIESHGVFTLNTPMKDELIKRGVPEASIRLLPNSCRLSLLNSERDSCLSAELGFPNHIPVIGYVGTFVQYEGLDHLAEACGLLKEKGIEFRLLIVGNENTAGTERGSITQIVADIARKYKFDDWLVMPGRVSHEKVESYYSLIDIASFPRKPQPVTEMVSPMKLLEAAAMKKAIVVSSVKALVDMVQNMQTGLVFEKGNVKDLSEKMELLIRNPNLRKALGENARSWVENERTWDETANKLIEYLETDSIKKCG